MPLYPNGVYSFDTSAFIEPWNRHYPRDIFPSIWDGIQELIVNKKILVTNMVEIELKKQRDDLYRYLRNLNPFVQPTKDEQEVVRQLINHPDFDKWIISYKHIADPFVVALAKVHSLSVVTYEDTRAEKNKIPAACRLYRVDCIKFVDFLRREQIII